MHENRDPNAVLPTGFLLAEHRQLSQQQYPSDTISDVINAGPTSTRCHPSCDDEANIAKTRQQKLPKLFFRRHGTHWSTETLPRSSEEHQAFTAHTDISDSYGSTAKDSPLGGRPQNLPKLLIRRQGERWSAQVMSDDEEVMLKTASETGGPSASSRSTPRRRRDRMSAQSTPDNCFSLLELDAVDHEYQFVLPTGDQLKEITKKAMAKMQTYQIEDIACGVCEILHEPATIQRKLFSTDLIQQMRLHLQSPTGSDIPDTVLKNYDASSVHIDLKGLLLYSPAFSKISCGDVFVDMCNDCEQELQAKKTVNPPTMAIANGNFIGWMPPHLDGLNRTDEQAIALVSPCMSLSTLTGGTCKVVKSHHYVVKNTEGPVVDMLSRDLTGRVRVTMVGAMTPAQQAACRKRYDLNILLCRQALDYFATNNHLYQQESERISMGAAFVGPAKMSVIVDRTSSSDEPISGEDLE